MSLLRSDTEGTTSPEEDTEMRYSDKEIKYSRKKKFHKRNKKNRRKTGLLSQMLCRSPQIFCDNNENSSLQHKFRDILTKIMNYRKIIDSNPEEKYFLERYFPLPLDEIHLSTLTVKVLTDQSRQSFANLSVTLEKVPVCVVCDTILDDTSLILYTLMEDKIEKLQLIPTEDRLDYLCNICKETTGDVESMKKHLLKHIENAEIACKRCEKSKNNSHYLRKYKKHKTKPKLENVHLSQVNLFCKLCNKQIFQEQILLSEIMTIRDLALSVESKTHSCYICNFDLSSALKRESEQLNYISTQKPICEMCAKENEYEITSLPDTDVISPWPSTDFEEEPFESEYLTSRFHHQRRHIYISDKNEHLELNPSDFLIKDGFNNLDKTWYTCRFCCKSLTDYNAMVVHATNHIKIRQVVCDECESEICWY